MMSATITCTVPTIDHAREVEGHWTSAGYRVTLTHTDDGPVIVTGRRASAMPPTAHELRDCAMRVVIIVLTSASVVTALDIATTLIAKAAS